MFGIEPRDHAHDHDGRNDERQSRHHESASAGATRTEMHREFGRVGSGDEIGGTHQARELVVGDPGAASHDFVAHHRDVGGRTPETRHAEADEEFHQVTQGSRRGHATSLAQIGTDVLTWFSPSPGCLLT